MIDNYFRVHKSTFFFDSKHYRSINEAFRKAKERQVETTRRNAEGAPVIDPIVVWRPIEVSGPWSGVEEIGTCRQTIEAENDTQAAEAPA